MCGSGDMTGVNCVQADCLCVSGLVLCKEIVIIVVVVVVVFIAFINFIVFIIFTTTIVLLFLSRGFFMGKRGFLLSKRVVSLQRHCPSARDLSMCRGVASNRGVYFLRGSCVCGPGLFTCRRVSL